MSETNTVTNGAIETQVAALDASKLRVTLSNTLKDVPPKEALSFGQSTRQTMTDHMLIATFDPVYGWSAPEIKPYGPISVDPAGSCFQYSTNLFEGMKAYVDPEGKPRLFRPELNMARMARSAGRVALPPFDTNEFLKLIKKLVALESRWIPTGKGYSLYLRPTMIGTRAALSVGASDHAMLYVICSPTGPYYGDSHKAISLLAVDEHVRAWPGGTGGHKLAVNYAPTLLPQEMAAKIGYDQCLWLVGEDKKVTEIGSMNFFVVIKRDDGGWNVLTPLLDGTVLPGVTRYSTLELLEAHPSKNVLPGLSDSQKIYPQEVHLTMSELKKFAEEGALLEAFGVGTAGIVTAVGRIGFEGKDINLPVHDAGLGPVARALYDTIIDIQMGRFEWKGWSVTCE